MALLPNLSVYLLICLLLNILILRRDTCIYNNVKHIDHYMNHVQFLPFPQPYCRP